MEVVIVRTVELFIADAIVGMALSTRLICGVTELNFFSGSKFGCCFKVEHGVL